MSTKITYNSTTTEVANGKIATLSCNGKKMKSDIVVEVPSAEDSAIPTEVSTEAEMTALLESGEVGGVYKYTGTTGTYENGALYVLEEEAVTEDALAGTWVFNNSIVSDGMTYSVNFTCNGNAYSELSGIDDPESDFPMHTGGYLWYYNGSYIRVYRNGWVATAYKTITITSNLADVTNGSTLLSWLQSNATKQ